MAVFTGDPSVLPVLTLFLLLGLGRGRETLQLKAFKLTVCKLFKRTQIYQRKGPLKWLEPLVNPSWQILERFLARAKKQIQFCSPHAQPYASKKFL